MSQAVKAFGAVVLSSVLVAACGSMGGGYAGSAPEPPEPTPEKVLRWPVDALPGARPPAMQTAEDVATEPLRPTPEEVLRRLVGALPRACPPAMQTAGDVATCAAALARIEERKRALTEAGLLSKSSIAAFEGALLAGPLAENTLRQAIADLDALIERGERSDAEVTAAFLKDLIRRLGFDGNGPEGEVPPRALPFPMPDQEPPKPPCDVPGWDCWTTGGPAPAHGAA
jgi:hypothetical protein